MEGGDAETKVSSDIPEFLSKNKTVEAVIGEKLMLHCQVNKLDEIQVCKLIQIKLYCTSDMPRDFKANSD